MHCLDREQRITCHDLLVVPLALVLAKAARHPAFAFRGALHRARPSNKEQRGYRLIHSHLCEPPSTIKQKSALLQTNVIPQCGKHIKN